MKYLCHAPAAYILYPQQEDHQSMKDDDNNVSNQYIGIVYTHKFTEIITLILTLTHVIKFKHGLMPFKYYINRTSNGVENNIHVNTSGSCE